MKNKLGFYLPVTILLGLGQSYLAGQFSVQGEVSQFSLSGELDEVFLADLIRIIQDFTKSSGVQVCLRECLYRTGVMFNITYQYLHDIFCRYLLLDPGSVYLSVGDLVPGREIISDLYKLGYQKHLLEIFHQFWPIVSPLSFVL